MKSVRIRVACVCRFFAAIVLWQVSGLAYALTLAPDPLAIPGNGVGTLIVSLPAPLGFAATIVLSVNTPNVVVVPTTVTIPAGGTSAMVQVTAVVESGTALITATFGADAQTIQAIVGTPVYTCSDAVNNAVAAANNYIARVQAVEPACRVQGSACNQAVAAAKSAFKMLTAYNKSVGATCKPS